MQDPVIISPISPERAQQILSDNGLQVSNAQAADILNFLTILATASHDNEKLLSIHPCKH